MTIRARAEQQAAGAEAANKDGEDRGGRSRRGSENQSKLSEPANLVHKGTEARTK